MGFNDEIIGGLIHDNVSEITAHYKFIFAIA